MDQDDFDTMMGRVFELLKGHAGIQVVTSCVTDLFFAPPELDDLGTTTNSSPQQPWDFILTLCQVYRSQPSIPLPVCDDTWAVRSILSIIHCSRPTSVPDMKD